MCTGRKSARGGAGAGGVRHALPARDTWPTARRAARRMLPAKRRGCRGADAVTEETELHERRTARAERCRALRRGATRRVLRRPRTSRARSVCACRATASRRAQTSGENEGRPKGARAAGGTHHVCCVERAAKQRRERGAAWLRLAAARERSARQLKRALAPCTLMPAHAAAPHGAAAAAPVSAPAAQAADAAAPHGAVSGAGGAGARRRGATVPGQPSDARRSWF